MDGSFRGVADAAVMSARLRVRSRVHDALKSDCSVEALVVLCTEAGALLTGSWEEWYTWGANKQSRSRKHERSDRGDWAAFVSGTGPLPTRLHRFYTSWVFHEPGVVGSTVPAEDFSGACVDSDVPMVLLLLQASLLGSAAVQVVGPPHAGSSASTADLLKQALTVHAEKLEGGAGRRPKREDPPAVKWLKGCFKSSGSDLFGPTKWTLDAVAAKQQWVLQLPHPANDEDNGYSLGAKRQRGDGGVDEPGDEAIAGFGPFGVTPVTLDPGRVDVAQGGGGDAGAAEASCLPVPDGDVPEVAADLHGGLLAGGGPFLPRPSGEDWCAASADPGATRPTHAGPLGNGGILVGAVGPDGVPLLPEDLGNMFVGSLELLSELHSGQLGPWLPCLGTIHAPAGSSHALPAGVMPQPWQPSVTAGDHDGLIGDGPALADMDDPAQVGGASADAPTGPPEAPGPPQALTIATAAQCGTSNLKREGSFTTEWILQQMGRERATDGLVLGSGTYGTAKAMYDNGCLFAIKTVKVKPPPTEVRASACEAGGTSALPVPLGVQCPARAPGACIQLGEASVAGNFGRARVCKGDGARVQPPEALGVHKPRHGTFGVQQPVPVVPPRSKPPPAITERALTMMRLAANGGPGSRPQPLGSTEKRPPRGVVAPGATSSLKIEVNVYRSIALSPHPNVVQWLGTGGTEGEDDYHVRLDYCAGGSLSRLMYAMVARDAKPIDAVPLASQRCSPCALQGLYRSCFTMMVLGWG
jgi:hypothetical protein